MKIVEQTPTKLVLRKDGKWIINAIIPGLLFAIVGLLSIYLGIVNIFTGVGYIIYSIGFILIGLWLVFMSLVLAQQEEEVTFYFDIICGCMIWKRRSIRGTRIINLPLGKISKVVVTEHTTTSSIRASKYSTIPHTVTSYKISLIINSNKRISLAKSIDGSFISHLAFCIAEFLQVPLNTPF